MVVEDLTMMLELVWIMDESVACRMQLPWGRSGVDSEENTVNDGIDRKIRGRTFVLSSNSHSNSNALDAHPPRATPLFKIGSTSLTWMVHT